MPEPQDLRQLRDSGRLAFEPLARGLRLAGIETPDVARRMLDGLRECDPCELFVRCPRGHFNPDGYAMLASMVRDWIRERGFTLR